MGDKYISMAKAAQLCSYDQEYLSLLARRGILKAEKVGRNWQTKVDWLNEYLNQYRPEEVISFEQPKTEVAEISQTEISVNNFQLFSFSKRAAFFVLVVGIIAGTFWWQNAKRLELLQAAQNENAEISEPREILRVGNDQGNIDIYETRRIKIGEEKIKKIVD